MQVGEEPAVGAARAAKGVVVGVVLWHRPQARLVAFRRRQDAQNHRPCVDRKWSSGTQPRGRWTDCRWLSSEEAWRQVRPLAAHGAMEQ
jgi:hypothetical protein